MRERAAFWGTAAVVLATAANLLHGVSHTEHRVPLGPWQWAYVVSVIFVAPVIAAVLLWTRFDRAGVRLLVASMAGSLVFGLAYHFLIPGPDNAFTLHPGVWRLPFRVSAALVALVSGMGCLVGVWLLGKSPRSPDGRTRFTVGHAARRRGSGMDLR